MVCKAPSGCLPVAANPCCGRALEGLASGAQAIVNYKWSQFALKLLYVQLAMFSVWLLSFTAFTKFFQVPRQATDASYTAAMASSLASHCGSEAPDALCGCSPARDCGHGTARSANRFCSMCSSCQHRV